MSSAFIDRVLRWGKVGIGEGAYGHRHVSVVAFFGMKHRAATDRAKPEAELRSMIADADEFRSGTHDLERSRVAGKRGEHATRALLASETVAYANA